MNEENETVENDGEDLAAQLAELREQLASERAEKLKVDQKNRELVREKQKIAVKAEDIETVKATLAERDKELRDIRISNEIASGLTANNVRPEMARAVSAMIRAETTYEDGQATIGGKSIQDHMKSYLGSKEGQHFVRPSDNSGAGATGSTTAKANAAQRPFNLTEYGQLKQTDPAAAASWASANGYAYLNDA